VLEEFGITSAPVPLERIAEGKGIIVRLMPLEDELSGMIFSQDGAPIIVINSLHHPNRQRFSLAHEIAHYELHMDDIGAGVHVDTKLLIFARDANSSKGIDRVEIEANKFAAELLVPQDFLATELGGRIVDVEDVALISDLARTFGVSSQMMAIRIGELMGQST
jgi:Zn-dependent peptidase ImmA (M78 family)